MTRTAHKIYIVSMVLITLAVTFYLAYAGHDFYGTSLEERFYHPGYKWFKPGGTFGHFLGIAGTLMILIGVVLYVLAKRYGFLSKQVRLKYILEFHIFLCILGPILIVYHTTFKFGGLVSVAFWSMVAVVLSGVIGRFIYIQIPRTLDGRGLSREEIERKKQEMTAMLQKRFNPDEDVMRIIRGSDIKSITGSPDGKKVIVQLKKALAQKDYSKEEKKIIVKTVKEELSLARKSLRLETMQKWLQYWHVFHMPFAIIMLIIVIVHVAVTLIFG